MEDADQQHRDGDDAEIQEMLELLAPDLQRHGGEQADGGRTGPCQHAADQGISLVRGVEQAEQEDDDAAGQGHAQECRDRPEGAAQTVADDHAHIGGDEAGHRLGDLQRRQELLLVEPALRCDEAVAEISDHAAAEADAADRKEGQEDLPQGYKGGGPGGMSGFLHEGHHSLWATGVFPMP